MRLPASKISHRQLVAALVMLLVAVLGAWLVFAQQGRVLRNELRSRSPQELIRYTLRRLDGHPKLEWAAHPLLFTIQRTLERPPPWNLPQLGKGQQRVAVQSKRGIKQTWTVDTPQALRKAMREAKAGTYIEVAPGLYPFDSSLTATSGGTRDAPIVLGAQKPGTVWFLFQHVNGIFLNQPHWVVENLNIRGECLNHDVCEHAFHIVGGAEGTVIRNNFLVDFNAHIKVNGELGVWPDQGSVEHNTMTLSTPRKTGNPVVAFDLVGANGWKVTDNLVTDIVKAGGNQVSYGMYMKGASSHGRFERNLIICSTKDISRPGIRVGLSFGGGNTGTPYCRDRLCRSEHDNGKAINNVIAHCNDSGIDNNRSINTQLLHNTLINTSGITSRQSPSQAMLGSNVFDGRALARDGSKLVMFNTSAPNAQTAYRHADALDLEWNAPDERVPRHQDVTIDFFLQPRTTTTTPGAVERHWHQDPP